MENDTDLPNNDSMSDDPEENLRMENELLRLKIQAELGGKSHSSGDLDPALENEFLKQVMAFEKSYGNPKRAKLFDLLGKPDFKQADKLSDDLISNELSKLTRLLAQNNVEVDFIGSYDDRVKYSFITEELFDHETDDFRMPGMTMHFCYEEFHPNHKMDIESQAKQFLSGWFEKNLDESIWYFDDPFVLSGGRTISRNELTAALKKIFDSYRAFTDCRYTAMDIGFELKGEGGMGYAEGGVKYNAALENNEQVVIQGPFKLYMSYQYGGWSIFHVVFPGFEC